MAVPDSECLEVADLAQSGLAALTAGRRPEPAQAGRSRWITKRVFAQLSAEDNHRIDARGPHGGQHAREKRDRTGHERHGGDHRRDRQGEIPNT